MNKKTIGVYGDSYANYGREGKSWVDLLQENYTVTNFGFPANSLFQCYKTILSNQKNYDYNIFIAPVSKRFFSRRLSNLLIENPGSFSTGITMYLALKQLDYQLKKIKNYTVILIGY